MFRDVRQGGDASMMNYSHQKYLDPDETENSIQMDDFNFNTS